MNVSLALTPEAEKRLAARAALLGKTLQGFIQDIVENEAASHGSEFMGPAESKGQTDNPDRGDRQAGHNDDDDEAPWRGVFAPPTERKTLFTTEVQFRISDLPRRKPHVTISPRWVDDDE